MKKTLFIVLLLSLSGLMFAQTQQDKQEVLQLCVDLPELQPCLVDANGQTLDQLNVKAEAFAGSQEISIIKFGKPVLFLDKVQLAYLGDKSCLDFFIFEVKDKNARVDLTFLGHEHIPKMSAYIEFEKKEQYWEITKLKSEER